jgi:hypothetical protein
MRYGVKDVDWEYYAALLAESDDNNQAMFFKSFLKECNSWGTHYQVEKQLAMVNLKLTDEEREQLVMLSCK